MVHEDMTNYIFHLYDLVEHSLCNSCNHLFNINVTITLSPLFSDSPKDKRLPALIWKYLFTNIEITRTSCYIYAIHKKVLKLFLSMQSKLCQAVTSLCNLL